MHSPYTYDAQKRIWQRPGAEEFNYSDGDYTEQALHAILQSATNKRAISGELLAHMTSWPNRYHLSPLRANLLRPHEHLIKNARVLELGGGCGAVTRYLGETAKHVTVIEGSARRASMAALRCSDLTNVAIYVDSIQEANVPGAPFDVVTLIGVLEYARLYDTQNADPTLALLQKAASLLAPGGIFIVALENQLGLKYYAGAPEDHLGQPMVGINDAYDPHGIMTFGMQEMQTYLRRAGFTSLEQFLPLPDYKMPTTIIHPQARSLSEKELPLAYFFQESVVYEDKRPYTFSMEGNWPVVTRNGLAWDMCNSLCFVGRKQPAAATSETETILISHYGGERLPAFCKQTLFIKTDQGIVVRRKHLVPQETKKETGKIQQEYPAEEPFYPYKKYTDTLFSLINRPGWSMPEIAEWLRPLITTVRKTAVEQRGVLYVPAKMQDCIPRNTLIADDGTLLFIDLEWQESTELIPYSFALLYISINTFLALSGVCPPSKGTPLNIWQLSLAILNYYGVTTTPEESETYQERMLAFTQHVSGQTPPPESILAHTLRITYSINDLIEYCGLLQDEIQSKTKHLEQTLAENKTLSKERDMLRRVLDKYTAGSK